MVAAVGLGLGECKQQARQAVIAGCVAVQAGIVPQGTGQVGFATAAGAGNEQVLCPLQPVSLAQVGNLFRLQVARVLVIDILDGGAEFETRLADKPVLFTLVAHQAFQLD